MVYDFDDGSFANIQNPQHQYTGAGTYNTIQIVSDQFGCVDTAFVSLVVNEGFAFIYHLLSAPTAMAETTISPFTDME